MLIFTASAVLHEKQQQVSLAFAFLIELHFGIGRTRMCLLDRK